MKQPMTKDELFRFLDEQPRIGRLATVSLEGDPHVVPVWFRTDEGRVLVHTMAAMRKARNVAATGRFALTVDTDEWPYRGVTMRGPARAVGTEEMDHRFIEDLAVRYLGEEHRPMGRYMADLPQEHATLVLEPESWHAFDYS
ncbi:MAG: pyridoxamine 5'-phosphate oxidase family protein [Acidimicrobiia bacterium]